LPQATVPPGAADDLRAILEAGREPLRARVTALPGAAADRAAVGLSLGRAHAEVLDRVLSRAFATAVEAAGGPADGIALAGVGGYGRGAVAIGSDLDVRLLTRDLDRASAVAEALLYPLWDSGLSLGHQVVTIEDLLTAARVDLPTATTLLDWRFVAGDRAHSDDLLMRARGGVFSASELPTFIDRLEEAAEQRDQRFGGSVYLLEPDVKNGPGAIRDVDVARWVARARWNVGDFGELVLLGVLVTRQLGQLEEARELLWRIRNLLHDRAGRRSDRLTFDAQEAIAPALGYEGSITEATERLMSDYYRAARTVSRFRDMMLARGRPALKRRRPSAHDIGRGVQLFDGEATVTDLEALRDDPPLALRLVSAAVDRRVPIRPNTRNAVVELSGDAEWCARLRAAEGSAAELVALVTCCAETRLKSGSILRELHDLGLLLAMIPEFGPVVGRVHHDTYHVYTVDVHSVAAVDRLGEIMRGDIAIDEEEDSRWAGSLAMQLAADISRPRVLFFATLLHDVGKSIGRRDHSERGAEMAPPILERLGFSPSEIEDVCQLIRHHLTMYLVATRRDLDDPATWAEVAALTGSREQLRNLYLLTVADLSTTSPTSMTSWKARMLDELFIATDRLFDRESPSMLEARQKALVRLGEMVEGDAERELLGRFLDAMPSRYAQANPPKAILAHLRLVQQFVERELPAAVTVVPDEGGVAQIGVVAVDRPGLLSQITATLAGERLQVHAAQIYSLRLAGEERTLAMDLFWLDPGAAHAGALPVAKLERNLAEVIAGRIDPEALAQVTRRRGHREGPSVTTRVLVDNRAAPDHTVIEVITRDRPGLLYRLARGLYGQGLSIAVAKIATEGTRVVDVFYVTDENDEKIDFQTRAEPLRQALASIVEGMDD
ncbi:MAG: [protein-PII] uridylyltransferase, partial [Myxococcales bacterium]|nr:[protein-PII] uridylyltransferase [Myxococcales bacterium]